MAWNSSSQPNPQRSIMYPPTGSLISIGVLWPLSRVEGHVSPGLVIVEDWTGGMAIVFIPVYMGDDVGFSNSIPCSRSVVRYCCTIEGEIPEFDLQYPNFPTIPGQANPSITTGETSGPNTYTLWVTNNKEYQSHPLYFELADHHMTTNGYSPKIRVTSSMLQSLNSLLLGNLDILKPIILMGKGKMKKAPPTPVPGWNPEQLMKTAWELGVMTWPELQEWQGRSLMNEGSWITSEAARLIEKVGIESDSRAEIHMWYPKWPTFEEDVRMQFQEAAEIELKQLKWKKLQQSDYKTAIEFFADFEELTIEAEKYHNAKEMEEVVKAAI
ncbi:uncharacterized protein EV420DRAFT_1634426 [Desarmillaria tabescens]|uniref:Uncharacterized protein n=1 Tax=Armillaria tabescens TaxID=1929756 RepID=A0AA39NQP3_ARMTA|nr:uncharacterized protein EV420DRAFT_1634426 [Desarmillaria tabescens]KAK0470031.1 hypothetical protein EV420DRAFT_1634426 [Desarmillaria tabescens]